MSIFAPDDFRADPYGHWTNQTAHTMQVGLLGFVWAASAAYFWFAGQFPYKEHMILFALILYVSYELIDQGWHGWDTVNDTRFVVGWGVAAPLMVFSEVEPGSTKFEGDVFFAAPFIAAFIIDLAIGAWRRDRRRRTLRDS